MLHLHIKIKTTYIIHIPLKKDKSGNVVPVLGYQRT